MAIMIRSSAGAESFIGTYPGYLILVFGIPFAFLIIFCVLGFFGYFACVTGNGITNFFRRRQRRRQERRDQRREHDEERWHTKEYEKRLRAKNKEEREQEKRRRRERKDLEKAQKSARRHQYPHVTAPETAHISPSSSTRFIGSHRPTHGSSARIAGSESISGKSVQNVSGSRSQIEAWKQFAEPGSVVDSLSLRTDASSQSRARLQNRDRSTTSMTRSRLQKRNRGHSAGTLSHGSLSPISRRSEDHYMGSMGSSSLLFDDRISIDQRSMSALGLLHERH